MSLTLLLTHPFPSQRLRKRQLMRINVYMLNTFVGCCGNCRLFETQDWSDGTIAGGSRPWGRVVRAQRAGSIKG